MKTKKGLVKKEEIITPYVILVTDNNKDQIESIVGKENLQKVLKLMEFDYRESRASMEFALGQFIMKYTDFDPMADYKKRDIEDGIYGDTSMYSGCRWTYHCDCDYNYNHFKKWLEKNYGKSYLL